MASAGRSQALRGVVRRHPTPAGRSSHQACAVCFRLYVHLRQPQPPGVARLVTVASRGPRGLLLVAQKATA